MWWLDSGRCSAINSFLGNVKTNKETSVHFYNIALELLNRGYGEEDIRKILGGNWVRLLREVWAD